MARKRFEKHSKLYSRGFVHFLLVVHSSVTAIDHSSNHERTQSFGDLERVFDSDLLLCVDFRQLSVQAR